ncbi:recombination endonuclease subunit [Stenotrophomonas phage vB_SmaS-DLP_6]|nr:recombination endonuclease subunit [Stenotrophomonas phage vB_SmaS-DLP_6]
MAKIALITDTHFGVRNDSQIFADHMAKFYHEVFFPYLDEHNIKTVRHLGDIGDRRKYVNYLTTRNMRRDFIDPCKERDIDLGIIIGNHDTFYKNTNEVNTMNQLYTDSTYEKLKWYDRPTEEVIDGTSIVLMPWICADTYEESVELMKNTKAQILMGHLEIAGFEMYRGSASEHGYGSDMFNKFDLVMSGHFHHKSTRGNINYLGAPYEMTWSDFDDARGFHIFDTDTRELTYIQNPYRMFHKLVYNDQDKSMDEVLAIDLEYLRDCYVKIVVQSKTNPYWFDMLIEKLEKIGIVDLKIVDDHLSLDLEDAEDLVNEAEDTLTIMKKFAASFLQDKDPETLRALNVLLSSLFQESLSMESDR